MVRVGKREKEIRQKMGAKKIQQIKEEIEKGLLVPKQLEVSPGNMLKYQNPNELVALTDSYIKSCAEKEEVMTMEGLALYLGDDSGRLRNYKNKDEYKPIFDYFKRHILAQQTQLMFKRDGKLLPSVKYYIENNFPDKYASKTVQDVNISGTLSLSRLAELAEARLQGQIVQGEVVE